MDLRSKSKSINLVHIKERSRKFFTPEKRRGVKIPNTYKGQSHPLAFACICP